MTDAQLAAKFAGVTVEQVDALIPWVLAGMCLERMEGAVLHRLPAGWLCLCGMAYASSDTGPGAVVGCAVEMMRNEPQP